MADGRRVDAALRSAVRRAVLLHERKNVPMVVWRRGKVTLVPAADLKRALRNPNKSRLRG
jgi:hypothetical protein